MTGIATQGPTGPINRTPMACWDCGAQPGTRHRMVCDLRPGSTALPPGPEDWAPLYPTETCEWCGEGPDRELGPVVQTAISPPVDAYQTLDLAYMHSGCSATAAREMVV